MKSKISVLSLLAILFFIAGCANNPATTEILKNTPAITNNAQKEISAVEKEDDKWVYPQPKSPPRAFMALSEEKKNRLTINLWGTSYHPHRGERAWNECQRKETGKRSGPNECNWGFGVGLDHEFSLFGEKHFSEINYFKNSFGRKGLVLSTGMSYEILRFGNFGISPALSLAVAKYEIFRKNGRGYPEEQDRYILAPLPGIVVSHKSGVDLNIVIVPHLNKNNKLDGEVEVWGFYLKIHTDQFFRRMRN